MSDFKRFYSDMVDPDERAGPARSAETEGDEAFSA